MFKIKRIFLLLFILISIPSSPVYAVDTVIDIAAELNTLHTYQQLLEEYKRLGEMKDQLTGNYGFGNLGYDPSVFSWGNEAESWQRILNLYQKGGNPGSLSDVANQLNQEFPIQSSQVANPNPHSLDAKYYELQAKTALAARAASQVDFDKIQKQLDDMHQLHDQIEHTTNIKASLDLQNRLQVESNYIQLELLRLMSLSNQQQAIAAQGASNAIVNNFNAAK